MKKIILLFAIFLLIIPFSMAQIPAIKSYVTDKAGILSSDSKSYLENDLKDLEKQTNGIQFVIYIENEYPKDYSLEEYTLKIAEQNKIGKKGNDNGILLYIAIKDRKYRWEVGYGAESTLNSPLLGRLSRQYLAQNFQNGDYEKGVLEAEDAAKRILLNSNDADIVALKNESEGFKPSLTTIIIFIFVAYIIISLLLGIYRIFRKSPQYGRTSDSFYRGAAGGLFMGGFGRGGSGGFGGFSGGGGNFGGGGFSGGWR